ncbi:MAG: hypothetical protein JNL57_06865 [Bacteroidetes bacterium]|nr:hypothetical protein [Bacteroidota bacterium]
MSDQKYLHELHAEHKLWISELTLATDELNSFGQRLQEVNAANTATEIRAQVEHFQNQFIRQKEVIDTLKHEINEHERSIAQVAEANNTASDHRKANDHSGARENMDSFRKIFADLKQEFITFLSKTM